MNTNIPIFKKDKRFQQTSDQRRCTNYKYAHEKMLNGIKQMQIKTMRYLP